MSPSRKETGESDNNPEAGGDQGFDSEDDGSVIDDDAFDEWEQYIAETDCKVVDLGNACWTYKHFSEDIQTRQVCALGGWEEAGCVCERENGGGGARREAVFD